MNVIRKIIFLTTLCGVVSGLCAQNISISNLLGTFGSGRGGIEIYILWQ